jgi:hypothetical protein
MLERELNFAVNTMSNSEMVCAAESARYKLPSAMGMEFCWRIRCMLEKSRPLASKITRKECMAFKSMKDNKDIRILQAEKGNCTVLSNESTYKEKISSLLESGVYDLLRKDTTSQIERKVRKLLAKHKTVLPSALKHTVSAS